MRDLIQRWIYRAFEGHCGDLHNADFEVCSNPRCWLAWQVEWRLYFWLYAGEAEDA